MAHQHCQIEFINRAGSKCDFSFPLTVAATTLKVDVEGRRFQMEIAIFFHKNQNNFVHLICQETVAVHAEFSINGHYLTKHANAYSKLTGSDRAEKVTQLEAVLASQQRFFSRAP